MFRVRKLGGAPVIGNGEGFLRYAALRATRTRSLPYGGAISCSGTSADAPALAAIHDATSICWKRRFLSRIALFLLKARLKVPQALPVAALPRTSLEGLYCCVSNDTRPAAAPDRAFIQRYSKRRGAEHPNTKRNCSLTFRWDCAPRDNGVRFREMRRSISQKCAFSPSGGALLGHPKR
jgi:hypothetical protein